MKILVTGGAGFIGSALIRLLINETDHIIFNIDKLTYAANLDSLRQIESNPCYSFLKADICNNDLMKKIFIDFTPNAVIHLAAESHVDRSITGSHEFIKTNINGTHTLLTTAHAYWKQKGQPDTFRFLHVSTDEVYGSLSLTDPKFTEKNSYAPNSPYSASKAASDHLVRAWFETYGLPVIITHCSNNYGPWQDTEKLIPLMITCALKGKKLPIYGKGENIRDWIYVDDHARVLATILEKGFPSEVYNIGGENEIKNINLVKMVCSYLDQLSPLNDGCSYSEQISYVEDRLGHDFRYAIDNTKITEKLGWRPKVTLKQGLLKTIQWYLKGIKTYS